MAEKKRKKRRARKIEPAEAAPPPPRPDDLMDRIQPIGEVKGEVKLQLYGRSGTGKTTLSSTFPKPMLLLDIREQGTDSVADIDGIDVLEVKAFDDIEMAYFMLEAGDHGYKTVVLDTLSMAQGMLVEEVMDEHKVETMSQRLWGEISGRLNPLIIGYRDLPMHVVFIAHDRARAGGEEGSDELEPEVGPSVIPSVARTLNGAVKIIGNTYIAEKVITKGAQISTEYEYRLRIGPHPYYTTKFRAPRSFEVPEYLANPTFSKLLKLMKGEKNASKKTRK